MKYPKRVIYDMASHVRLKTELVPQYNARLKAEGKPGRLALMCYGHWTALKEEANWILALEAGDAIVTLKRGYKRDLVAWLEAELNLDRR